VVRYDRDMVRSHRPLGGLIQPAASLEHWRSPLLQATTGSGRRSMLDRFEMASGKPVGSGGQRRDPILRPQSRKPHPCTKLLRNGATFCAQSWQGSGRLSSMLQ
jgi:hypothetical protein